MVECYCRLRWFNKKISDMRPDFRKLRRAVVIALLSTYGHANGSPQVSLVEISGVPVGAVGTNVGPRDGHVAPFFPAAGHARGGRVRLAAPPSVSVVSPTGSLDAEGQAR